MAIERDPKPDEGFKIIVAESLGFCPGVKRAVSIAREAAKTSRSRDERIYTLGPLIHNPDVVAELREQGVRVVDAEHVDAEHVSEIDGQTVVIRSHGTTPGMLEELRRRRINVVDATCPYVKRAELKAKEMAREGRRVVIIGDPDHPEVKAIAGWAGDASLVVNQESDLDRLSPGERIGVIAQTTLRSDRFAELVEKLRERVGGDSDVIKVEPTMCEATSSRQEAMRKLCSQVDAVIVVGGYGSANTKRLVEIAREEGKEVYHIERADEVRKEWFLGKKRVGISAGASTPVQMVKEVIWRMVDFGGKLDEGGIAILEKTEENVEGHQPEVGGDDIPAALETGHQDEAVELEKMSPEATGGMEGAPGLQEAGQEAGPKESSSGDAEAIPDASSEQAAALALSTSELYQESLRSLEPGDVIQGKVVRISDDGVLVDVGYKTEGVIPLSELSFRNVSSPEDTVKVGDEIAVYVMAVDSQEAGLKLSKRRADEYLAWENLNKAWSLGEVLTAEVIQEVKGGLVVDVGLRGFVPASQIERGYVSDLASYVGKTLRLKVLELDRSKNRVILSQRQVLEEELKRLRENTWNTIREGMVLTGVVKGITDFGAFVDIGGVDGLLHVSELSWGRVDHPSSVVKEGDKINVMVLRIDREKGRISLGLKQTLPDPWESAGKKYEVDSVVKGKITRLAPFGAFVELEPGVEGLVHISELADHRVEKPEDVVSVGDEVAVKVLRVRVPERRISLSIKQAAERAAAEEPRDYSPSEDTSTSVTIGDVVGDLFEANKEKGQ
ncbi:MAG TPA: bifunctional 4-hydroxy-3-methylbut-2-enyl diphosphate reductase/30S ribosomal protein S1 [Clostridia bacterium]|nr:bifunctional 4-hydroxy-3-methylbut-2-enyl diphosphate reductase/30S ribosomal protein S1 [Clostridia bacterium]